MVRNKVTVNDWVLENVDDLSVCEMFDCGNGDLNDYFHKDVKLNREELLSQTYRLYKITIPDLTLALLDFCNDSVRVEKFPHPPNINPKINYKSLPAVKLTRLGVKKEFQLMQIGTNALNMVKRFFTTDNRTGCRFLTVDSYSGVIGFYKKNGFILLTDNDRRKATRTMCYDLRPLKL